MRVLTLLLLLSSVAWADPIIGERAPPLAEQDLKSGEIVVDFFATWCGPCHEAMAALGEIVKRRGLQLVVVDVGEPPDQVRAWVAQHPLPPGARLVFDPRAEASHRWGQRRFPTTFVLHDGVIRHINRGFGPGYARRMDGWIAKDLGADTAGSGASTPAGSGP